MPVIWRNPQRPTAVIQLERHARKVALQDRRHGRRTAIVHESARGVVEERAKIVRVIHVRRDSGVSLCCGSVRVSACADRGTDGVVLLRRVLFTTVQRLYCMGGELHLLPTLPLRGAQHQCTCSKGAVFTHLLRVSRVHARSLDRRLRSAAT